MLTIFHSALEILQTGKNCNCYVNCQLTNLLSIIEVTEPSQYSGASAEY